MSMQIGLNASGRRFRHLVDDAVRAETEGFHTYNMSSVAGHDPMAILTAIALETERIQLLTGVVPIFGTHPSRLAAQALTVRAAAEGRFTLGIGLSHQVVIEGGMGLDFARPGARMRDYLDVLQPRLRGEDLAHEGEFYTFRGGGGPSDLADVPLMLAAMAPVMLRLAGERTDGTVLWMAGAKAVSDYVRPRLERAASNAGRPGPRVVAGLPVALVPASEVADARAFASQIFERYGEFPSYRSMLDQSGAELPGDAALVGDEATLDAELDRLEAAGVDLFTAAPFRADDEAIARTRAYLADRASQRAGAES
jgi:5,10-methylenetetrahydromethanopterin reductase